MSAPQVSITAVVVTRDRPALLRDALASIDVQRLAPIEVRVGDDGSIPLDPGDLPASPAITLVRCGGGSAASARNRAAAGASGEILAFLDDDDLWRPEHLARVAAAFADASVQLAYADAIVARETVSEIGTRSVIARRLLARRWEPEVMGENDYVPPSGLAVRRALFRKLGGFDESFRYSEDWDFLLRAARLTVPHRIEGIGVEVRLRPSGNASADFGPERIECLRRLEARNGLPRLVPRTFWEVAELLGEPA